MSGHSKWSKIKRQKESTDAKRGAVFTKLSNLITLTAKEKGGDIETNFSLRMAIDKAKQANMPKDNIDKAIKRGTGELAGEQIQELMYEGFGPAKIQVIIRSLTDNKNRSAASIRHTLTKYGGSLGAVMWNFEQKGVVIISDCRLPIEDLELELIDAGAQDIIKEEEGVTIYTDVADLQKVKKFLEEKEIKTETADIEYVAKDIQTVNEADKEKIEKFIQELEDNEDVGDYYLNVNI
ncbi:YebC/PmpR family DNA-binding transcriptional regulator [Patescibacteria group bacterium]